MNEANTCLAIRQNYKCAFLKQQVQVLITLQDIACRYLVITATVVISD